jgi:Protein of unknown function (DUF1573)
MAGQVGSTATPSSASLRFETTSLQLGEVRSGLPLGCQFAFDNAGPGAVQLMEARPGCGCLKPRLTERMLAPGQRGVLPLELQTLGQPAGPHTWQMTLLYKDGERSREQLLQVSALVVNEVNIQPAALTLFAEGALSHDITLTDLRPEPLQIVSVDTTAPFLEAKAGPLNKDSFGNFSCRIKIETVGKPPVGRHDEVLVIHTNDPLYREFKVPITVVKKVPAH